MPDFIRLRARFKDDENFRLVLAMIYSDILEFHRRAYKFFRRRSKYTCPPYWPLAPFSSSNIYIEWQVVFDALWKDFESRFNSIIERLGRHKQLLMNAAITIDVTEARSWRMQQQKDLKEREKIRKGIQLRDSIGWLHVEDELQEDEVDKLSQRKQPGSTCHFCTQFHCIKTSQGY